MKNAIKIKTKEFFLIFIIIFLIVFSCYFIFTTFLEYKYPLKYKNEIIKYSNKYKIAPELVASVINVESHYNENAVSYRGAIGLMQLMPSTAQWVAEIIGYENYNEEQLFDPVINIELGCYYLSYLSGKFQGVAEILASYNAGEGTVRGWLKNEKYSLDSLTLTNIPYLQTRQYVEKVNKNIKYYTKKY